MAHTYSCGLIMRDAPYELPADPGAVAALLEPPVYLRRMTPVYHKEMP